MAVVRAGTGVGSLSIVNAIALALSCLAGCGDAQHTVGVLEGRSSQAGANSGAGARDDGAGGQAGTRTQEQPTGGSSDSGSGAPTDLPDASSLIPPFVPPFIVVDPACEATAVPASARRLDLYLMIDTNITIPLSSLLNGPFDLITEGVLAYASAPSAVGTGLGLAFYGSGTCDPDEYETPTVPVDRNPLPSNLMRIALALRAPKLPPLTSAIGPALAGAIQHASTRLPEFPAQQPAVVLITDGFLDATCNSTSESVSIIAEQGLAQSIRSYVIELRAFQIPISGPSGTVLIPLGPVAEAGGTERAYRVNLVGAEPADLSDALSAIQRDAEPCDYALPEDGVWEDLFLAIDSASGPIPIVRLDDASDCSERGGLYLLNPNAASDETLWARACEASCEAIKQHSARPPSWLYGCPALRDGGI